MVFQGDSDGQDIVSLADDFAGTNSTSYPIAKKVRAANTGERLIMAVIYQAYGGWHFDNKNNPDLPEGVANLVADQQFYLLPDEVGALNGVSYLDSSGTWHKLHPITLEAIRESAVDEQEFMSTPGNPLYYRPVANGFKIYPASDASRTGGLGADVDRDTVPFTTASTNQEPGFDRLFHEALAVFIALQHLELKNKVAARTYQKKFDNENDANFPPGYIQRIKAHYQTKFKQLFPQNIKAKGRADFVSHYE